MANAAGIQAILLVLSLGFLAFVLRWRRRHPEAGRMIVSLLAVAMALFLIGNAVLLLMLTAMHAVEIGNLPPTSFILEMLRWTKHIVSTASVASIAGFSCVLFIINLVRR